MKLIFSAALFLSLAAPGFSVTDTVPVGEVWYSSVSQDSDGPLRRLEGQVRIETANVVIQADKAVYNVQTSDIQASGDVHITLKEPKK